MARARSTFRQADITRALCGLEKAGRARDVRSVEINSDGKIILVMIEAAETEPSDTAGAEIIMSGSLTEVPLVGIVRQTAKPWLGLGMSRATWYRLGTEKPNTVTQRQHATILHVSIRSIQRAKRVAAGSPLLAGLVRLGKIKLGMAEKVLLDSAWLRSVEAMCKPDDADA